MKPWIKIAIAALLGFGGGFATGFFVHKKMNDIEFEEVTEEEMQMMEGGYNQKANGNNNMPSDETLPTDPDKLRRHLQGKKSYIEADREAKEAIAKVWNTVKDYSSEDNANELPVENVEEGFDQEFLNEISEEDNNDVGGAKLPYPIYLVDFYNERNEYDKITIDWYEPENMFVDEKGEIIGDATSYIGHIDIKKLFSENTEDEDPEIRYVRNEAYSTDYEIIRHHESWAELNRIGGSE